MTIASASSPAIMLPAASLAASESMPKTSSTMPLPTSRKPGKSNGVRTGLVIVGNSEAARTAAASANGTLMKKIQRQEM